MIPITFAHSGGELQRFAIAVVAAQQADIYMIDEPSSYLDVRQRLKAAQVAILLIHPCTGILHELSAIWMYDSSSTQVSSVSCPV